jgi:hypothetical protein
LLRGVGYQFTGKRLVGVNAHALCVVTTACKARMIGDELRMQQHVAVDEHQVVGVAGGNGEIAQAREAKPRVRL